MLRACSASLPEAASTQQTNALKVTGCQKESLAKDVIIVRIVELTV
jgi:hypothetical protein